MEMLPVKASYRLNKSSEYMSFRHVQSTFNCICLPAKKALSEGSLSDTKLIYSWVVSIRKAL